MRLASTLSTSSKTCATPTPAGSRRRSSRRSSSTRSVPARAASISRRPCWGVVHRRRRRHGNATARARALSRRGGEHQGTRRRHRIERDGAYLRGLELPILCCHEPLFLINGNIPDHLCDRVLDTQQHPSTRVLPSRVPTKNPPAGDESGGQRAGKYTHWPRQGPPAVCMQPSPANRPVTELQELVGRHLALSIGQSPSSHHAHGCRCLPMGEHDA